MTQDTAKMMTYDANKKSAGIAYVLRILFGTLRVHRFYLGENRTGFAMLGVTALILVIYLVSTTVLTLATLGFGFFITLIILPLLLICPLIDFFLIPGMVQSYNNKLAQTMKE